MKNIIFFITHATLNEEHAEAVFKSISKQIMSNSKKFDVMYIYNTHQHELSNEYLVALFRQYVLKKFIKELKIFDYDPNTPKKTSADFYNIGKYCRENYSPNDRVLFLKSDCVLSRNFFDDALNLPHDEEVYFVAPWICAKERVTDEEIFEYAERDKVILSDDITFFVEDQYGSQNNDFNRRPDVKVTDESIKFTSCYVVGDLSCPLLSVSLTDKLILDNLTWGGVKFYSILDKFMGTERSFVIHKFHGIISDNRSTDREGPVAEWLAS